MFYIKNYSNQKETTIKEAKEIKIQRSSIDLNKLLKEHEETSKGEITSSFHGSVEWNILEIFKINNKLGDPYTFSTSYDFDLYGDKWANGGAFPIVLITYKDSLDNDRFFVPSGTTYVINEKGSTIETIK